MPGAGVGIVVLKRLDDAIADGDHVYAVIKGTAVNNDGSLKVGYTAPSVDGQAEVIAMAQAVAGVAPETISYIEAHGTGTSLGDPIEIAGLTKAFRAATDKKGFCAIGSVKTNIGHTDTAAGVAGVDQDGPGVEAQADSTEPSFFGTQSQDRLWEQSLLRQCRADGVEGQGMPRRAAVSSFGIGGTNAHAILEEAPRRAESFPSRPSKLLVLSAKTGASLEVATKNFLAHLKENSERRSGGRRLHAASGPKGFQPPAHRCLPRPRSTRSAFWKRRTRRKFSPPCANPASGRSPSCFPGRARSMWTWVLISTGPKPRSVSRWICARVSLKQHLGFDLRDVLYPNSEGRESAAQQLNQTATTQPATVRHRVCTGQVVHGLGNQTTGDDRPQRR